MMRIVLIALTATGLVFAQTAPPPNGGWRRATPSAPAPAATAPPTVAAAPVPATTGQDPEPVDHSDAYGQPGQNEAPPDYSQGQARRRRRD